MDEASPAGHEEVIRAKAETMVAEATDSAPSIAPELTIAHRELAGIVLADRPLGATLTRVAQLAREVLPGADEVSVTMIRSGPRGR